MHLKSLELRGFKSFAKGVEIEFRPGINVIVGPNGCGKSNIADAIRWVLGEANIRNLRGQRGEDVIFTGTDKKKPLGMAMVSMTLDNQDNLINSEYSDINITRRIYRTGESQFLINAAEVRLKDIHSLLAGTGLGKRGYAIIGQGELEQVLDAKPFERRLIIEEAAGLSGYRLKKDEAENKLQASSQDIIRLEDILAEVKQRVDELEEKAEKAGKYLQLDSERGTLERKILAYELFLLNQELGSREQDLKELAERLLESRQVLENKEKEIKENQERLRIIRESSTEAREKKFHLVTRINQQENEVRLSQERIDHAHKRLTQLNTDIVKYGDMMNKLKQDLNTHRQELALKEAELKAKEREAEAVHNEIVKVQEEFQRASAQAESDRTRLIDYLSLESTYKNEIREKEERLRKNRDKLEFGRTENQYRLQKIENWQEDLAALEREIGKGLSTLEGLQQEKQKLDKERQQATADIARLENELTSTQAEYRGLENRLLTLEDSIKAHVGMSEGVRRLLDAIQREPRLIPGFIGVLSDLIEVPSGLEAAVEAAAGRSLENLVVNDYEDAKVAINLLKAKSWGRVTFLPLNLLRHRPVNSKELEAIKGIPGVLGLAAELVKFSPHYRLAVEHVLGRVLIVENLDVGLQVFKKQSPLLIVTVEGEIINPSGAMTGGRYRERTSPLRIRASYREIQKEMGTVKAKLKQTGSTLEEKKSYLQELDDEAAGIQKKINETLFQLDLQKKERERLRSELDRLRQETSQFLEEEKAAQREISALEKELSQLTVQCADLRSRIDVLEKEIESRKFESDQLSRQLELLRERHANYSDLVEVSRQELESRRQGIQQLAAVKESYEASLEDYDQQVSRFTRVVETESERIKNLEAEKEQLQLELKEIESSLQDLEQQAAALQEQMAGLQETAEDCRKEVAALEDKIKQLEIRKARIETEQKNLLQVWEERCPGESVDEPEEGMNNRRQRVMRERLEVVKEAIEDLGPVDVTAIEELKEVRQRFDFLRSQLEDLQQARQALTRIIEETEAVMNSRFNDFLAVANASFKKTFHTIFQGGEAELIREENEDIWQSGVEIMVKMPGKKRQSLNLLSGGERALTCIAFIFSLLMLKPTPFCLFDEVDSALDDANLARFTEFLKRLAEKVQFIVITHRQGTIEVADNIFGVTMAEQGLSEVYSLSPEEAEAMAG
ncbi:MAG: chromosome segregation protein SMC [Syntrophomonadaceae bacterium]|nr:chromosome segregation protein SMC [Syntrophomonadaceae bacterium]